MEWILEKYILLFVGFSSLKFFWTQGILVSHLDGRLETFQRFPKGFIIYEENFLEIH